MTLSDDPTDPFMKFMQAFPDRDGGHDADATRDAWERALKRAQPETIVAGAIAYRAATQDRPRRYVMSARRWLQEGRWRDAVDDSGPAITAEAMAHRKPLAPMVWIECGSPEWEAWAAFRRATRGKGPPIDSRGGWRFPTRFPPAIEAAE